MVCCSPPLLITIAIIISIIIIIIITIIIIINHYHYHYHYLYYTQLDSFLESYFADIIPPGRGPRDLFLESTLFVLFAFKIKVPIILKMIQ